MVDKMIVLYPSLPPKPTRGILGVPRVGAIVRALNASGPGKHAGAPHTRNDAKRLRNRASKANCARLTKSIFSPCFWRFGNR